MSNGDLLEPERVGCDLRASSKKRALEQLSQLLATATPQLSEQEIFESLIGRERLGSTGLGQGVAIPHARIKGSDRAIGAFAKLATGVDFDAVDDQGVDLIFALLVPEHYTNEHLQILADLAEMFSDKDFCHRLRDASCDGALYQLLEQRQTHREPA
ncbi:MAG: PTS IIA-like nitrogen regulatory protein PtsN [Gammaproteobacteria bacterium]|nr:PTS IIA-like nitrogen regulatory protein PtsN [Gammaproteobacteria bacterium]NIR82891.1 PTS IIA-like nitrogen regulatory protein PtsN [Gammaproteobacteria bacterium]NIR90003.1 PTS IIA-like nitrogen regulatory protein PtsN [Gammaproteobacteria bacterium]NIU03483.1 PTS IIA-like nitrogen regulatory protein PtsN [Gammaproteobacteria bacterium]NIV51002.1 PTS IIA-like nitrogen regulatory protein PtsN [Gammaproteobacteria bacterium]